jgi:hypothetical protein
VILPKMVIKFLLRKEVSEAEIKREKISSHIKIQIVILIFENTKCIICKDPERKI